ncbi:MAG TPA: hypothetical protein PLN48_04760 [Lachnospiraceae bacterium]|jgi:hypothetical protein|nr:hypothetical protein [Lachnospiraceae bacterium]
MGRKNYEKDCFDYACEDIKLLRKWKDISSKHQERPDFIFLDGDKRIGLEHFLIDTLLNEKQDSQSRHREHDIYKVYDKYKDGGYDRDPEGARQGIEDLVNKDLKTETDFDYRVSMNTFMEVFDKHLSRVEEYRSQGLDRLGFLMEIRVPRMEYLVTDMSLRTHKQCLNDFPLTADMWQVISQFDKIDFLIITVVDGFRNRHHSYMIDKTYKPKLYHRFALVNQGLPWHMKLNVVKDKEE